MDDQKKTILGVYALVLVGSLLMLAPIGVLPFAGMACLITGMISAYIYRWRSQEDFMQNQMTFIIRTIWWASLILFIGILLFCSIIVANGDLSMITALTDQAENGIIPNDDDVRLMQHQFLVANKDIIIMAGAIGLLPYPLYLIYRTVNGVRYVLKKNGD